MEAVPTLAHQAFGPRVARKCSRLRTRESFVWLMYLEVKSRGFRAARPASALDSRQHSTGRSKAASGSEDAKRSVTAVSAYGQHFTSAEDPMLGSSSGYISSGQVKVSGAIYEDDELEEGEIRESGSAEDAEQIWWWDGGRKERGSITQGLQVFCRSRKRLQAGRWWCRDKNQVHRGGELLCGRRP